MTRNFIAPTLAAAALVSATAAQAQQQACVNPADLADAVLEAQSLGLAEADPGADLDGRDAAAKLSILAYRAFGAWVRPDAFTTRGILEVGPHDCDLAEVPVRSDNGRIYQVHGRVA